jgi:hypothetical protein
MIYVVSQRGLEHQFHGPQVRQRRFSTISSSFQVLFDDSDQSHDFEAMTCLNSHLTYMRHRFGGFTDSLDSR